MSLENVDWYWSSITRNQANDLLHGAKEGTFLVRNSTTNPNDYTLTVKKDGINKMMRIICKNGKYDFCDPPKFDSVQKLIEFHTKNFLSDYYSEMNTKLEYPMCKSGVCKNLDICSDKIDVDLLTEKLKTANQEYLLLLQKHDDNHRMYRECQDEIQKYRQSFKSFEETFAIFEEQIKINEENQKEALAHELPDLMKHRSKIETKLKQLKDNHLEIKEHYEKTSNQSLFYDKKIIEIKPLLNEKKRQREQIIAVSKNLIGNESVEKVLEFSNSNIYSNLNVFDKPVFCESNECGLSSNYKLNYCNIDSSFTDNSSSNQLGNNLKKNLNTNNSNYNKSVLQEKVDSLYISINKNDLKGNNLENVDWYLKNISKKEVDELMINKPDGTFLLRDSEKNRPDAQYTLAVRINGKTRNLRILNINNRFGFSEPLKFDSVVNLINYHLNTPIIFDQLNLTIHLKFPWTKEMSNLYLLNR